MAEAVFMSMMLVGCWLLGVSNGIGYVQRIMRHRPGSMIMTRRGFCSFGPHRTYWYIELEYLFRMPFAAVFGKHRNPSWLAVLTLSVMVTMACMLGIKQ